MIFRILIRGRNCADYIEKCINSLYRQTYNDWRGLVLLDAPKDNSYEIAKKLIKTDKVFTMPRLELKLLKEHRGLCWNMYDGIYRMQPLEDDVCCILDADDYLKPNALQIIRLKYVQLMNTLVTYGSYIKKSVGRTTKTSKPYPNKGDVRILPWSGSHFKTFKYKLFTKIPVEYFKDDNGDWLKASSDRALMYALIELAGLDRCQWIKEPIYVWRDCTPWKTNFHDQKHSLKILQNKPRLQRCDTL